MQHRHHDRDDAGVHGREPSATRPAPVYDIRALAATFILVGVSGPFLVVRRKADGAVGTMRHRTSPLAFYDFRPLPGDGPRPTYRGSRT